MVRKPSVGSDANAWGTLLNEFLDVEHNIDGTFKSVARPADITAMQVDVARAKTRVFDVRDYASIQAAVTAAGATITTDLYAGTVFLPRGEYLITSQIVVPRGVILQGSGNRATRIKADPTFPTNTTLIKLGSNANAASAGPFEHDMLIRDMEIDCNNVVGSTGVESQTAQEPSGLANVLITRYRNYGVNIHSPNGYEAANSFRVSDCEFFHAALGSNAAIRTKNLGISMEVHRTTVTGYEQYGGATNAVAIDAEDCNVILDNVHLEFNTVGVWSKNGTVGIGGLKASFLDGHSSVASLVKVSDQAKTQLSFVRDKGAAKTVDWTYAGRTITGFVTRFDNTFYTHGPQRVDVVTVTNGYLYCQPWNRVVLINATSAACSIDLPEAIYSIGAEYLFKKIDASANAVTITRASTDTIEGAISKTLTPQWATIRLLGTATGWVITT